MSEAEHEELQYLEWLDMLPESTSMEYDKAFGMFYDEFAKWLMENEFVCNGHMLTALMENPDKFEEFISEQHPEIGELV